MENPTIPIPTIGTIEEQAVAQYIARYLNVLLDSGDFISRSPVSSFHACRHIVYSEPVEEYAACHGIYPTSKTNLGCVSPLSGVSQKPSPHGVKWC